MVNMHLRIHAEKKKGRHAELSAFLKFFTAERTLVPAAFLEARSQSLRARPEAPTIKYGKYFYGLKHRQLSSRQLTRLRTSEH